MRFMVITEGMSTNYFDTTTVAAKAENTSSDSSESSVESTESEDGADTAAVQGKTADRLEMFSAIEAFAEVQGPPKFLNPNATHPQSVIPERKRKETDSTEDQPQKKPRPVVITAKAVTYDKPRIPQPDPPPAKEEEKGEGSAPMEVGDFLSKGGGAMLPRKNRVQREKEKAKREKGQSSHSVWKSEEEMLLRQQYDS